PPSTPFPYTTLFRSDKIAGQRTTMTESIERRNSGAHERRGLGGIEGFGHPSQRFDRRNHEFLIAPVVTNSANLAICAVGEITSPDRKSTRLNSSHDQ